MTEPNDPTFYADCEEAITKLMASGRDFVVRIVGPAFKEDNCLRVDSTLELRQIGYGNPHHKEGWEVVYNGRLVGTETNLSSAIAMFGAAREEKELGMWFVDIGFCGHAGPMNKQRVVIKEPEYPEFALNSWVWDQTALGLVIAEGDWPGWYRIWYGGGEIVHRPSCGLRSADQPPEICGFMKPGDLPGWNPVRKPKKDD